MSYAIGHTLVTPLPDGRVSYTPCRHCGEECRGHSMAGAQRAERYVSIDRKVAEILSDAANSQACELRRFADEYAPGTEYREVILADAAEIDAARIALDVALGRVS